MVERFGLDDIVTVHPAVPRSEALRQALETHVQLVLTAHDHHAYTFKLFDALATGAQILNIGGAGAAADLLVRTGRGISADSQSLAEIRNGIMECIRRSHRVSGERRPDPWRDPSIQEFNFQHLSTRLVGLLEGLG